jgi:hypothetical protein
MMYQWQKRRVEELQGKFNQKATLVLYGFIFWAMLMLVIS